VGLKGGPATTDNHSGGGPGVESDPSPKLGPILLNWCRGPPPQKSLPPGRANGQALSPGSYSLRLEKTCNFFALRQELPARKWKYPVEEERLRSASAPDGEETRLALAAAAVTAP
jgi:hypothetical protein